MPRATNSVASRRRRKKVLKLTKGYWGAKSKLYRTAHEAMMKALSYAYRDRRAKKRDFRSLWITRIGIAARNEGISYNKFIRDLKDIEQLRVEYLGRKGIVTLLLRKLGSFSAEERPKAGQLLNQTKREIEELLKTKEIEIEKLEKEKRLQGEGIDITLPGRKLDRGTAHTINLVLKEIEQIFLSLGFKIEEGPEVELDYYNFEALYIPKDHPARDDQDSFYINKEILLRTHTSPAVSYTHL